MANPTRIEVNCETGITTEIELTDAEVAEMSAQAEVAAAEQAAREAEAEAKAAARASLEAKLAALGISAEELATL